MSMSTVLQKVVLNVLVLGKPVFRASIRLLRVDADGSRPATEAGQGCAQPPQRFGLGRSKYTPCDVERMAEGLRAVFGKWPGDETDEEIQAALEELS
jgi:hypothetical protein